MPNNVLLPGVTRKPTRPTMKINHSKKKITKKKNNTLNQIINYLKSNPYMYSHLISPCLPSPPPEMNSSVSDAMYAAATEEKCKKKKKLVERVRDYMQSDDYLYKPLLDTPCYRRPATARLVNHSPPQGVERQQKHPTDVRSPMGLQETIWRKNKEQLFKKTSNHNVQADDQNKEPFNSSSSTSLDEEEEEDNTIEDSSILHPRTPAPYHDVVTARVLRRRTLLSRISS